jgi:Na+/H+ antiporter NhaD/arsenite permease-like protein
LRPLFLETSLGATLMYWVTVPIVGIVEHDAYILRYLRSGTAERSVAPGLWWMMLWAGTLGSNLTVAGAPALFAAVNICGARGARCHCAGFWHGACHSLVAAFVCYAIGMVIWVLPYVK